MTQIHEDPVLRQRHSFHHPSEDVLIVESWVDPGGGVTPHVHPSQHERFSVLEGECTFTVGRKKVVKRAGEDAEIPPGTRHAYRNSGTTQLHMRCEATPPMTLEGFLIDVAAMSRAGLITSFGIPKGWRGLLAGAVLLKSYRDMAVILNPPPLVQRLVSDPLAPLGRRRGFVPGRFAEALGV
jgi:mannose-6-phosphate isomerase-like protein (cupin superfamily)